MTTATATNPIARLGQQRTVKLVHTHRLHFIGNVACVAQGCEPSLPPRPTLPDEEIAVRALARRLGGGRRARAAAERIVESRDR